MTLLRAPGVRKCSTPEAVGERKKGTGGLTPTPADAAFRGLAEPVRRAAPGKPFDRKLSCQDALLGAKSAIAIMYITLSSPEQQVMRNGGP